MHTYRHRTTIRARALSARIVAVVVACVIAVCLVLVAPVSAEGSDGAAVRAVEYPGVHDAHRGWTTRLTTVRLLPEEPGTILYTWDSPLGGWASYTGELVVPEGKNTLHAVLLAEDGTVRASLAEEFRVDFDAPVRSGPPSQVRAVAAQATGGSGSVTVSVTLNPWAGPQLLRLGGRDRYQTSAMVSAHNFPSADTVIIATGLNFADALASSGLAGCVEGPILLTKYSQLPSTVAAEIRRLGASEAIIVGGPVAVDPSIESQLAALGVNVSRIGGRDRYETAAMIAKRVVSYGQWGGRVYLARGDDFADALALGPLAYASKAPLLLVKPNTVPPATRSFLSANQASSGCFAGGTVAVSESVARVIRGYAPAIVRVAGSSRYSTAAAIASYGAASGLVSFETVGIATGTDFADALCGGVGAGVNGGVILLTKPGELPTTTSNTMEVFVGDMQEVQVFGGERAVYPEVMTEISDITF